MRAPEALTAVQTRIAPEAIVGAVTLKRGLIGAMALWLSVVTLSNLCDGLKTLGVLPAGWPFASGNYAMVVKAMEQYALPAPLIALTFAGVIAWEGGAAALLWWCTGRFRGIAASRGPVYIAFGALISLWLAFMFMDEVFLQYPIESTHVGLLIASLVALLAVVQLPE